MTKLRLCGRTPAVLLAASLAVSTVAADPDPAVQVATNAKAIAEAERDAAKARLDKAESDAKLATIDQFQAAKNAEALAAAQKAEYDKDKAAADARAAAIAADQAAIKAKFGGIAANGVALPGVEASTGAGSAEANVLAARELNGLALQIARGADNGTKAGVIIVAGTNRPQFANTLLYEFRRPLVAKLFTEANLGSLNSERELDKFKVSNANLAKAGINESLAALTAAGAALDAASKIASYFQTSYKFDNLTVTSISDQAFAMAVAGEIAKNSDGRKAFLADRVYDDAEAKAVFGELDSLIDQSLKSNKNQAKAEAALRELDTMLKAAKADDKKRAIETLIASFARSLAAEKAAVKALDDFVALLGASENGKTMIQRIGEERALAKLIRSGLPLLYLNVSAQGGTSYTRKSIWNFLGAQPMFVSGSVVVNWALVGQSGQVVASGVATGHSGYKSVGRIAPK